MRYISKTSPQIFDINGFMRFVTNSTSLNFKCRLVEQIIKINPGLSHRMVAIPKKMRNIHVLHPRLRLVFGCWPLLINILDEKADYDSSPYHLGKLETISLLFFRICLLRWTTFVGCYDQRVMIERKSLALYVSINQKADCHSFPAIRICKTNVLAVATVTALLLSVNGWLMIFLRSLQNIVVCSHQG